MGKLKANKKHSKSNEDSSTSSNSSNSSNNNNQNDSSMVKHCDQYCQYKDKIINNSSFTNQNRLKDALKHFKGGESYQNVYTNPEFNEIVRILRLLRQAQQDFNHVDTTISQVDHKLLKLNQNKVFGKQSSKQSSKQYSSIHSGNLYNNNLLEENNSDTTLSKIWNKLQDPNKINAIKNKLLENKKQKKLQVSEIISMEKDDNNCKTKSQDISNDNEHTNTIAISKEEDVSDLSSLLNSSQSNSSQSNSSQLLNSSYSFFSEEPFSFWKKQQQQLIKKPSIVDNLDLILTLSNNKTNDKTTDTTNSEIQDSLYDILKDIFLKKHELYKYYNIFKNQEIDKEAFLLLTKQELIDIGITLLGPQIKILHTINQLKNC